jgi:PAS domain S-box-containing protein
MSKKRISLKSLLNFLIKYLSPFSTIGLITLFKTYALGDDAPEGYFMLYTIPILIHTAVGGLLSGVLTLVLSTLSGVYFFISPINSFRIDSHIGIVQLLLFTSQTLILSFGVDRFIKSRVALNKAHYGIIRSERRLKSIIDSLFMLIATVDKNGVIKDANKAILEASPYETSDLVGKNILDIYLWNYSNEVKNTLKNSIEGVLEGEVVKYDEVLKIGKDRYIDAAVTLVPIFDSLNNVDQIIISAVDISERKTYERELEKIHENYSKLVNSNVIGMVIASTGGEIFEANEAFLGVVGYSREDLDAGTLNWRKLNIPDEADPTRDKWLKTLRDIGYVESSERDFIHKDGHIVPTIVSSVMIDLDREIFIGLLVDISERKRLEQKKDEFISIASHELKTPLTTLSGYAQLIDTRMKKEYESNLKFLSKMDQQFHKLNRLINDLLDVSKIQSGKLSLSKAIFNIVELVEETIQEVEPISNDHKLTLNKSMEKIQVDADIMKISQVLTNFLTNAIKYSPKNSSITVNVSNSNDDVLVEVIDEGRGIAENLQKKVFDKFFQVDNPGTNLAQGMGLGLYISSEIIKRHGGTIGLKSQVGKGSTFYFTLPKAKAN